MNDPTPPARRVEFYRHDLGDAELDSLRGVIGSTFLALGPRVAELERTLAEYLGLPHVVGVHSGTAGLTLALLALGVRPGDEVIVPSMTFVATANAALYVGARPVFAEVDPATGLLDPAAVAAAVTPRTTAVCAVHLYGQLADMPALRAVADRHGLALVEDSAHGCEMRRGDVGPGRLGDAAVFSFYATKTMTCGDGGAIAVRDPRVAESLRRLRNHGIDRDAAVRYGADYRHWDMVELGHKAAMTDIDAALLLPQIPRLAARRAARERLVLRYERGLADLPGVRLIRRDGVSAHHLFTVLAPDGRRDELLAGLGRHGIGVAVNYRPVHLTKYYRERLDGRPGSLPHTEEIGARTISLPLYPGLADDDADYVIDRFRTLAR